MDPWKCVICVTQEGKKSIQKLHFCRKKIMNHLHAIPKSKTSKLSKCLSSLPLPPNKTALFPADVSVWKDLGAGTLPPTCKSVAHFLVSEIDT